MRDGVLMLVSQDSVIYRWQRLRLTSMSPVAVVCMEGAGLTKTLVSRKGDPLEVL